MTSPWGLVGVRRRRLEREIREARAILAESQSIRNSIRGLLAERVTGDACMHLVPPALKENAAPRPGAAADAPAPERSGLDALLEKREAKVTELREHMDHLHAATTTAGGGPGDGGEEREDESLVLFPSDFTRLVDELFERRRRRDGGGRESGGADELAPVDRAASSVRIHEAVAVAMAMDDHEHGGAAGAPGDPEDERLLRELGKVDRLDKDLAKCIRQADSVARSVYPEKYAALDRERREKLERRVKAILEKDRRERERRRRLDRMLEEAPADRRSRLTEEDERLVERVLGRGDGDDEMMNPYDEEVDDDEFSETMSVVVRALARRGAPAARNGTPPAGSPAGSPARSPAKSPARSPAGPRAGGPTSQRENLDYLAQFREEKEQHQQLRDIDQRIIRLRTSAYPDRLDERALRALLDDCAEQEELDRGRTGWKGLEEEHSDAAPAACGAAEPAV